MEGTAALTVAHGVYFALAACGARPNATSTGQRAKLFVDVELEMFQEGG